MQNFSGKLTGQVVTAATNMNVAGNAVEIDPSPGGSKRVTTDALIYNPGPATVRVRFGTSNQVTAHNTTPVCIPITPGYFTLDKGDATHIAAWVPSGTQDIEVFLGRGN